MKCDDCLNLLEEYLDGEAGKRDAEQVNAHLITCANCASELEALTAEQEIYARYDRELQISPSMWNAIAARTVAESYATVSRARFNLGEWLAGLFAAPRYGYAGAMAVLILAIVIGVVYLRTRTPKQPNQSEMVASNVGQKGSITVDEGSNVPPKVNQPETGAVDQNQRNRNSKSNAPVHVDHGRRDQSDVLFDAAYTDIEDKETAEHLGDAQNLLISFRSLQLSDDDQEVDVTYEKTESRRLLNENVVLRRDAEMAGKFPAKSVLGSLEPFLIDIANLPDKAPAGEVRQIKDRVQKTEIVAELRSY